MEFQVGQEFINEYPIEAAEWCTDSGIYTIMETTTVEQERKGERHFQIVDITDISLSQAKQNKLDELETAFDSYRESKNTYINSSLGFKANANVTAYNNVDGLISQIEYGLVETDENDRLSFMDFDNKRRSLSLEDLKVLKAEIAQNGSRAYSVKWEYRAKIEQAQNVGYLNNLPEFNFNSSPKQD